MFNVVIVLDLDIVPWADLCLKCAENKQNI
jgi:hypothetical protein